MPVYLYRCEYCGEYFEKIMPLSEADSSPECPYCKCQHTQKQITTFSTPNSAGTYSSSGCGGGPTRRFT